MRKRKLLSAVVFTAGMILVVGVLSSAEEYDYTVAEIDDLRPDEMEVTAFVITRDMDVHIEAVGGEHRYSDWKFGYPWLLNAETRRVIWSMDEESGSRHDKSTYLIEVEDDLELRKGTYELYYYSGRPRFLGKNIEIDGLGDLKDLLKELLGGKDRPADRELAEEFYVRILSNSDAFMELGEAPGPPASVVEMTQPDNEEFMREGFVVASPADFEVYMAGEYSEWSEVMVDWGWIVDVKTHERVWEMDRWNSEWAGGADKNRVSQETITLPAGEYIAYYVTDDSHTYDDWNENPPYDPQAWGLRIRPVRAANGDLIHLTQVVFREQPLITINKVCNNEYLTRGLRLKSPVDLYIYAIGEDDRYSDGLADYGWITDAESGDRIWIMEDDNTRYAGGDTKNRMFDGVVSLGAGDYVVHYLTDGSHSYCDWNATAPYDRQAYGIAVYLRGEEADLDLATLYEPSRGPKGALAALTCVNDNERRRARFTLEKVTRIRIYAVGEGDHNDMYDYGWIENADDGTVVWEMTYRKTEHAGGADKNRLLDQIILLDKGNYIVHYVTDGSHSCPDWNAASPDDPMSWGIVISAADR